MYQRILVPIDGSATSALGLAEAIKLAKLTGGSLRLIHIVDAFTSVKGLVPFAYYADEVPPKAKEAGQLLLEQARGDAASNGVRAETFIFESRIARVAETVVDQANAWNADLIVIGTHGRRGVGRALLGSDAEQIVRAAPVPVLLIRGSKDDSSTQT